MKDKIRILTSQEFKRLSLAELESQRSLIRDVHFTIHKSVINNNLGIMDILYGVNVQYLDDDDEVEYIERLLSFVLSDDTAHSYFFDWDWPDISAGFLRKEDIISSHIMSQNMECENLSRVLKILMQENAHFEIYYSKVDIKNDLELQAMFEDIKKVQKDYQKSKGFIVRSPINNMYSLRLALKAKDPRACQLIGTITYKFTKALKRTDGDTIELFNHSDNEWQVCENVKDVSSLNIFDIYENSIPQTVQ